MKDKKEIVRKFCFGPLVALNQRTKILPFVPNEKWKEKYN